MSIIEKALAKSATKPVARKSARTAEPGVPEPLTEPLAPERGHEAVSSEAHPGLTQLDRQYPSFILGLEILNLPY